MNEMGVSLRSGALPLKQSPYQWWSLLRRASSQRQADLCIVRSTIHQNHSDWLLDIEPILSRAGQVAHRTNLDGAGGKRLYKNLAVAFAENSPVEDCYHTTIRLGTD